MALFEEEKIGACTSHVKDSKATLLPRSFPTRPKNCIHHIIPFSLFTDDLVKRFPSNLYVKRKLMEKHGEPKNNLHYNFRRTPSDGGEGAGGVHYLSLMSLNAEDIPSQRTTVDLTRPGRATALGPKKKPKKNDAKPTVTVKSRKVTPKVMCQFCDKTYKQQGALRRHTKEKHGVTLM